MKIWADIRNQLSKAEEYSSEIPKKNDKKRKKLHL
jgi:hypothetical protein